MLRFRVRTRPRIMSTVGGLGGGQEARLKHLRKLVTMLIRQERVEWTWHQLDEARGYAEKLIMMAVRNGDHHKPTMEMADYWLMEKDLIHKLFKVLVPRYQNLPQAATNLYRLPSTYPGDGRLKGLLELKGNPWPPVLPQPRDKSLLLTNILLSEARREHNQRQSALNNNSQRTYVQAPARLGSASDSNTEGSSVDGVNVEESSTSESVKIANQPSPGTKTA